MSASSDKRTRLIVAANRLFHRHGYERSSIADIAVEAGVPVGNIYYYFKTKDDLAEAVTERRIAFIAAWLQDLDGSSANSIEALVRFIEEFEASSEVRAAHGCPVGGFCQDASRLGGAMADLGRRPLQDLMIWLNDKFDAAGSPRPDADAAHLLAGLEGASLLAHAFGEPRPLIEECRRLKTWVSGGIPELAGEA